MDRVVGAAREFLRCEDGSAHVQWMYGFLLLLVLGGVSVGSLERQWDRTVLWLLSDAPVRSLMGP